MRNFAYRTIAQFDQANQIICAPGQNTANFGFSHIAPTPTLEIKSAATTAASWAALNERENGESGR